MTDRSRIRFYFPAWRLAWARIRALDASSLPEPTSLPDQLLRQVLDVAGTLPASGREAAVRHACHRVALGREASSKEMSAAEADRVVLLFRLLADPTDLGAAMTWDRQGPRYNRGRLLWAVRNCGHDPEYIGHICRAKFRGQEDPTRLTDPELHDLVRTLSARARARTHNPA
jgi:hypothetical protein